MRGRARACAHGDTTPMHLEDCPHKMHAVCPPVLGHNIPIYEEGALISAVTAVMQECCRKFSPRIFPEIRGGHTNIVVKKKRFPITLQALFLSDLEGVIHSRFTLQPPYIYRERFFAA